MKYVSTEFWLVFAAIMFATGFASDASADSGSVTFNASFELSINCNQPKQLSNAPVHGDLKGVLNSDKSGSIDLTLTAITTNTIHFDGKLGGRPEDAPGGTSVMHVLGRNKLQGIWELPNQNIVTTVTVSDHTCDASLEFKLKYGNKQYSLFDGQNFYFCSKPTLLKQTCAVN